MKCPDCGKRFDSEQAVQNHRIAKHGAQPVRPFVCHCGKGFKTPNAMAYHKRDAHQEGLPEQRKPKARKPKERKRYEKPQRVGEVVPCPVHGLPMVSRKGPFGTYHCCPKRPECDIIGDWSDHDGRFHVSTQADRDARKLAHATFDPLWQSGHMRRHEAYRWLAEQLGITDREQCHIKHFKEAEALRVVAIVQAYVSANPQVHDLLLTT